MADICQRRGDCPPSQEYEAIFDKVNRGLFEIYDHCLEQGIPWCKIRPGLWEASEEDIQIHMANKGMASKPKPVLPMKSKAPTPKKEMPQKRPPPSLVDIETASGPPTSGETPPARKVLPPPRKPAPPVPKDPRVSSKPYRAELPSSHSQAAPKAIGGPQPPPYPPPGWGGGAFGDGSLGPKQPSFPPPGHVANETLPTLPKKNKQMEQDIKACSR